MSNISTSPKPELPSDKLFLESFEKTKPERDALAASALVPINVDVNAATSTVRSALPYLKHVLPQIQDELPKAKVDPERLSTLAEALFYVNAIFVVAVTPAGPIAELAQRGAQLRDLLFLGVTAMAKRGIIEQARVDLVKKQAGYMNLATDMTALVVICREKPEEAQTKGGVSPEEVAEAAQIAERIAILVGERAATETQIASAGDERQRAFTLLANEYNEARRAVSYLRWNDGDADELVPSIWAGRGGSRTKADAPKTDAAGAAQTKTDGALPPKHGTAEGPPATAGAHPATSAAPGASPPAATGLPGSSPFTSN